MAERLRFALDQNFPPFVLDVADYFTNAELTPLFKIDPRVSDLDDRSLILYLHQAGWHGLITNNYKMLWVPSEISAIVKAKIAVFAVEGLGNDPLRATGSVLLHLPAILNRVTAGKAQVFRTGKARSPQAENAWTYFQEAPTAETSTQPSCMTRYRSQTTSCGRRCLNSDVHLDDCSGQRATGRLRA